MAAITHQKAKLFRQQSSYRFHEWRPWLTFFWLCHFSLSVMVIVWGGIHNHDTKYIPINVEALDNLNCSKGFVNVFASSKGDSDALVCCGENYSGNKYLKALEDGICNPPHFLFFVSRRLARFPEAWLLPLFPLFVRLLVQTIRKQASGISSNHNATTQSNNNIQYRLARRRFYFYVGIIQFRGWILYLLFDKLEEWIVASTGKDCWYEHLLHDNYHSCQGQGTDFSDHVVLYFAQILPIAFIEILHSFVEPFWIEKGTATPATFMTMRLVPIILITGMMYLYVVTFMGAYKTAVYFHTWPEIRNGYFVSLLVQVPLFLIQCTPFFYSTREYFFGYAS
ncbi:hypothetical protein IV203_032813 [Nitzschia inconspicua]|uniref:Uncharacterized protein n=1 Tax=Nitzschia inconspicua TaxID=303405 RepID=A0A9K3PF55_9STRA|nr:hypothetical protein IV203_032813 [Nitzschia inconspicua]